MAHKLITKEIERKLEKTPIYSTQSNPNAKSICKFFNPCGIGTWYVFEGNKLANGDWMLFGIAELQYKEMGCFLLSELAELRLPYGLTIERDIYHTPMTKDEIFNM